MVDTYDRGDVLRVKGTYIDVASAAVDPQAVKFSFKDPNGNVTTYTYGTDAQLVKDSTGVYHADVHLNSPGLWFVRHWSTGNGEAASEKEYLVKPGAF